LGETRGGETSPNAKSNRKVAKMKRQKTKKTRTLNKKFKALQRKVAYLKAGKAAAEEGVSEKDFANDSPPVGAGQQLGGRAGRAGCT